MPNEDGTDTPAEIQKKAQEAQAAHDAAAYSANQKQALGASLTGPWNGSFGITGTPESIQGGLEGLQFGQMLYGQGIGDVGKEASDYSAQLRGRMNKDSISADVMNQNSNRRVAQGANKIGMAGASMGGAQEALYRQNSAVAQAENQKYQDAALMAVGKNIGAKQQGQSAAYFGGKASGQAATPTPVASSEGGSIICTELFNQGKITKEEWAKAGIYGRTISLNTYIGYLIIASPIVVLMKKSDKFSNLFIGWTKSIAAHKPNLLTRIMTPVAWSIGYVKTTRKEKTFTIA